MKLTLSKLTSTLLMLSRAYADDGSFLQTPDDIEIARHAVGLPDYDENTKCIEFPGIQQPQYHKCDIYDYDGHKHHYDDGKVPADQCWNLANDFTDEWHYCHYITDTWSGYQLHRVKENLWRGTNANDSCFTGLGATVDARNHTVDIRIATGETLECRFTSDFKYLACPVGPSSGTWSQISWAHDKSDDTEGKYWRFSLDDAKWLPMKKQHDGSWVTGDAYALSQPGTEIGELHLWSKKGVYIIRIEDA